MLRFNLLGVAITSAIVLRNSLRIVSQYASPSPSKHSQPLVADLFRKQARPLLSTASLSLAALWRFGAVPLLEALTLLDASWCFDALALCGSLTLLDALATQRRWTQETAPASKSLRLCGFAALRLCGFSDPWGWQRSGDERRRRRMSRRACGSAALRLARSMAALRLWRFWGCARVPEPACNRKPCISINVILSLETC